jgi:FkbM family methyltransferase
MTKFRFHHSIPILRRLYLQRDDARKQTGEARKELDDARKQTGEARKELDDARKQTAEARKELDDARKQTGEALKELDDVRKQWEEARVKSSRSDQISAEESTYGRVTYSIEAEDLLIERFFDQIFGYRSDYKGFYVDIGAADPIRWSNTYSLYKRGWRGINIEPNPDAAARFAQLRPNDINLTVAVGEEGESGTYTRFENPCLNIFLPENAQVQESRGQRVIDVMEVPFRSINSILSEYVPAGASIDFLNIDVELMELRILSMLDFSRWSPPVIAAEIHGGLDIDEISSSAVASLLRSHGYFFISRIWHSSLFVQSRGRQAAFRASAEATAELM